MNGNKKCYGRRYGARSECADCPLQSYCKEARDGILTKYHPTPNRACYDLNEVAAYLRKTRAKP